MSTYKCYKCRKTYKKRNDEEWNDFKASEEFLNLYPECKNDSVGIVCEDCNEEFKKWFSLRTAEEKKKMREKYNDKMHKR